jgi:predicted ATP-grasp superfamily ATP-dependent carboligase
MSLPAVILLGLDTTVGLVALRELGRHGVPVIGVGYHAEAIGRGSRYLTEFIVRPEEPVTDWLPALVRRTGAGAVLPMKDRDILAVAKLGEAVLGCRNLGALEQPMEQVLDKSRTLEVAARCGIEVPRSWQPLQADDPLPELGWPVVLKWADPMSVMATLKAAGLPETKAEYYSDAASLRNALERYAPVGRLPLVQSYCRGRGLGQFLYMADGKAVLRFQHERVHEWPPEGGVSSLCRAVPLHRHADQMARSEALLEELGWDGFAMVEYRHDPQSGRHVLMEVNGHLWGSLALASACGAEFAWEAYRRKLLGRTDPAPPPRTDLSARDTVKETRRIVGLLLRRGKILDPCFRSTPWRDLARYLWGFVDPWTRPYAYTWSDPAPSFRGLAASWRRLRARKAGLGPTIDKIARPVA